MGVEGGKYLTNWFLDIFRYFWFAVVTIISEAWSTHNVSSDLYRTQENAGKSEGINQVETFSDGCFTFIQRNLKLLTVLKKMCFSTGS